MMGRLLWLVLLAGPLTSLSVAKAAGSAGNVPQLRATCDAVCSSQSSADIDDRFDSPWARRYLQAHLGGKKCRDLCRETESIAGDYGARLLLALATGCRSELHDWEESLFGGRRMVSCFRRYLPMTVGPGWNKVRRSLDGLENEFPVIDSKTTTPLGAKYADDYVAALCNLVAVGCFSAVFLLSSSVFLFRAIRFERLRRRMLPHAFDHVTVEGVVLTTDAASPAPIAMELEMAEGMVRMVETGRRTSTRPFLMRLDDGQVMEVRADGANLMLWMDWKPAGMPDGFRHRWVAKVDPGQRVFVHGSASAIRLVDDGRAGKGDTEDTAVDKQLIIGSPAQRDAPRLFRNVNLRRSVALLAVFLLAELVGFGSYFHMALTAEPVLGVTETHRISEDDRLHSHLKREMHAPPPAPEYISTVHIERDGKAVDYLPANSRSRGGGIPLPLLWTSEGPYLQPEPTASTLHVHLGTAILLLGTLGILILSRDRTPWYFQRRVRQRFRKLSLPNDQPSQTP